MHIKVAVDSSIDASPDNLLTLQEMVLHFVQETPEVQAMLQQPGANFAYNSPLGDLGIRRCYDDAEIVIKIYMPSEDEPEEVVHSNTVLYSLMNLPHRNLQTLWRNIVLPDNVKAQLRQFVRASKHLAACGVDTNIVSTHKMLLLHSVPGCGKTSIVMALAQELSVDLFSTEAAAGTIITNSAVLVTVNAHALFSKWFSESGKIITRLFTSIAEEASDGKDIYLLIDEIESLAGNRERAMAAGEPSDMVRAANAMLTQLDQIKRFPNVYTICTTNMLDMLDPAFLDRCDAVIGLTLPVDSARKLILTGIITELLEKRVLTAIVDSNKCTKGTGAKPCQCQCQCQSCAERGQADALMDSIVVHSSGLSGRQLRKLPYNALSFFDTDNVTLIAFLDTFNRLLQQRAAGN